MAKTSKSPLSNAFLENNQSISKERAHDLIVKSEVEIRKLKESMAQDEKLAAAQSIVKDIKGGYSSAIKYEEAKIQFLLEKLEEQA